NSVFYLLSNPLWTTSFFPLPVGIEVREEVGSKQTLQRPPHPGVVNVVPAGTYPAELLGQVLFFFLRRGKKRRKTAFEVGNSFGTNLDGQSTGFARCRTPSHFKSSDATASRAVPKVPSLQRSFSLGICHLRLNQSRTGNTWDCGKVAARLI
ncbi:unnamed protein product, partial [Ixodes pacificus]